MNTVAKFQVPQKEGNFNNHTSNYQLLKDSNPWSHLVSRNECSRHQPSICSQFVSL